MSEKLRVVSYGGGVQSTALLVLAARGVIDFPLFLMANVGDDSEDPRTLAYVAKWAGAYAEKHGIQLEVLKRRTGDGEVETVKGRILRPGSASLTIPFRRDNGMPGQRSCTADFKRRVTGKRLVELGAHGGKPCKPHAREDRATRAQQKADGIALGKRLRPWARPDCEDCLQPNRATVALGYSLDEIHRCNATAVEPHERLVFPLVGLGEETGLKMTRQDCIELIRSEGLPVPPKSSCYFCPFHRPEVWLDLRRQRPDLFDDAVELEREVNRRQVARGRDPVWLTRFARPLDEAIGLPEPLLFDFDPGAGACSGDACDT